jgi:hypothetical protein
LETPNQQQLQPLIEDELSHVLAVYDKIDGNRMLPLETPNQQQLQPLNDDELSHLLAVYDKIERN